VNSREQRSRGSARACAEDEEVRNRLALARRRQRLRNRLALVRRGRRSTESACARAPRTKDTDWYVLARRGQRIRIGTCLRAEDKVYGSVCACALRKREGIGTRAARRKSEGIGTRTALRKKRRNWHARSAEEKGMDWYALARRGQRVRIDTHLRVSPFLKTRSKDRGQRERMSTPLL